MDSKRFDNWTRNRALRLSRRDALRLAAAGGASGALAARSLDSLAQTVCTLTIHGETAAGPSTRVIYDGSLKYTVDSDGTIAQGTFTPAGGVAMAVRGSVTGRAIDLQIDLATDKVLALSGVADVAEPACPKAVAGLLAGPQPGDIGGWQATSSATTAPSGSTSSASSNGPCSPPQTKCGPNCCPGGATCTDANQGICACPNGTIQCGTKCVPACPQGQNLDLDTCTCGSTCKADGATCATNPDCCSGFCDNGACQTCQFLACDGIGCVDPSIDANNCGACGNVCVAPKASCTDGVCACQPDGLPCVKHYDCCSDSCANGICGCLTVGSDCSNFDGTCCDNGVSTACVNDICRYLDARHACFADNECLTDICSNGACASCLDPGQGPCTRDAECCNYNGLGCVNGVCPQ